jgi:amino acid transporter
LGSIGFYLNVSWENAMLPSMLKRATGGTTTGSSILIIAAKESGIPYLAGFFNAALMMTVFSSANTALYVASRTLYGLARDFEVGQQGTTWRKWIAAFGKTSHVNKVPIGAVLASFILFFWLPALHVAIPDQSV